jgi:N utilization substance protein A
VAAQTAKQVIIQKLREAERDTLFELYQDRVGEVVNATVQRLEGVLVYMDLGQATAIMPPGQQIRGERYNVGGRFKVYLMSVEKTKRGPEVIASRTAPEMVSALFAMEVPEVASGAIEIKALAREAGSRSKIAVKATTDNIDPIGSCVGQRGARVQTVMSELGGEKIDIIEYSDDTVKFLVNALSPAKVQSVQLVDEDDENNRTAIVHVPEDQLSLAIGKGGQNVRLAAKLVGWKIDIAKADEVETIDGDTESADEAVEAVEADTEDRSTKSQTTNQTDDDADDEEFQSPARMKHRFGRRVVSASGKERDFSLSSFSPRSHAHTHSLAPLSPSSLSLSPFVSLSLSSLSLSCLSLHLICFSLSPPSPLSLPSLSLSLSRCSLLFLT